MKIKFFGAAGMVTGSSFLLTNDKDESILIDCGMFQGPEEISRLNWINPEINFTNLKGVILTHAHLDHCGRLPILVKMGLKSNIFMTEPTKAISEIILSDAVKVSGENKLKNGLFNEKNVEDTLKLSIVVSYHEIFRVGNFEIEFFDAGHILGSASVKVKDILANIVVVFSGDLGNSPEPLVKPTEFIKDGDIAVMESTYGGRVHDTQNPVEILQKEINSVESFGGVLLIPSFSIERAQVLLHMIDHLKKNNLVKYQTPVYLDSPMAIKATICYENYPALYNNELLDHVKKDSPFDFPGLIEIQKAKKSREIEETLGPKVIIAGSGMMNGGRILDHAIAFLPLPTTRLLFVGYQAERTLGREILNGARTVRIKNKNVNVNAKIREITTLSSHADENGLLNWISEVSGVKKVFLVHGEDKERFALSLKIRSNLGINEIFLPKLNESIQI